MDLDYRLPGTDEPAITIRRTTLGGIHVLVDGVRAAGRAGLYEIPGADGEVHLLKVQGAWRGLHAIADGWDTPLEPDVPTWALALMALPLVLLPVGGLVGGLFGGIGVAANGVVGRSPLQAPARVVVMMGVLALALEAWLGVAMALTTVGSAGVSYATGTCLDGIAPGTDLVSQAPRAADCGTAHDGEVIGTFDAASAAAYPGETGLT